MKTKRLTPTYNEVVFSEEQLNDIKDSYLNGESSPKIGKRYGVGHKVILKQLHRMNVIVDQKRFVRKYSLDENYFDVIDCPNKAYILGLLYSDGSNNPKKSTVSISLQEEDKELLERVKNEVGSEKPLEFLDYSNKHDYGYHYKNQYRLLFFSQHMCQSLIDKGVIPNKSLKTTFPEWLDESLYSHFIRGMYDGDGSVCQQIKNDNNHPVLLTITATESFCESLQKICQYKLKLNSSIKDASCHNGITKVFIISGRNVVKIFLDWLYQDADIFLQRKYDRYVEYYSINNSLMK